MVALGRLGALLPSFVAEDGHLVLVISGRKALVFLQEDILLGGICC
jgi:hypothetical protein